MLGDPARDDPKPQAPPKGGIAPRVDVAKVAAHLNRLPHSVLGWVGGDGLPMVARVEASGVSLTGIRLTSVDARLPPGGRRAGPTSHLFRKYMVGQEQRVHTGWLTVDSKEAVYAPHTAKGYAVPPSSLLMALGAGISMRRGARQARALGLHF